MQEQRNTVFVTCTLRRFYKRISSKMRVMTNFKTAGTTALCTRTRGTDGIQSCRLPKQQAIAKGAGTKTSALDGDT